jgi:hypothetical protein
MLYSSIKVFFGIQGSQTKASDLHIELYVDKGKILSDYFKFEVFTAVTMKNVFFWHTKTQFVLHTRNITSPLQSPATSHDGILYSHRRGNLKFDIALTGLAV